MKVLILNAGSSSQKSCLYDLPDTHLPTHPPAPLWSATIDWTVSPDYGLLTVKANNIKQNYQLDTANRPQGLAKMLDTLITGPTQVLNHLKDITVVGHRIVHGGDYTQSTPLTPTVKQAITDLIPLAPSHNPAHLQGIEAIEQILGDIPQIAVFDTAFHTTIPPEVATYPLPYEWKDKGIRRYGFHGTSHRYCAEKVAELLGHSLEGIKLLSCHLGNGASLTAIKDGKSINTTMGFTPLEGLMMGTRSGSIDPAILIYLMREYQFTAEDLNTLLNQESGLKGISGISADMRSIVAAVEAGEVRATLALQMYVNRLQTHMGSLIASLAGLDVVIFTAGVGENSPLIRQKACEPFEFLGLKLDLEKNAQNLMDTNLAIPQAPVKIFVIHTEEDWAIAKDAWSFCTTL